VTNQHTFRFPGALALLALVSAPVFAQMSVPDFKSNKPVPRMADGHPDLSGYWKGTSETKPGGNIAKDLPGLKLPLTPAGEAAWKHNLTATVDPEAVCILGGIPRHNASGLPFEILHGANKLAFLYWYSYYRLIPIDAKRKHTEDPDPSFFGEELGRWEGDTLVIDSTGFKDTQVWADENGSPHSDALHVVERWTRPDGDHIHVETLIEDPKFYTRPFTYSRTWVAGKPDEEVHEYACSENNVDRDHLGFGPGPIRKDGTRGYENPAPLPPPLPERGKP
jgi:hypothetical protein